MPLLLAVVVVLIPIWSTLSEKHLIFGFLFSRGIFLVYKRVYGKSKRTWERDFGDF